ncbi:MAG: YiiD C-terminal domain-containing protein [Pseudomonadota bacterium]
MEAGEFQTYLENNIAMTGLMKFRLVSLSRNEARAQSPLSINGNHRGSAFGGSLYNTLVLTSYSWLYGGLLKGDPDLALLIQKGEIEYLEEVLEDITSVCSSPGSQQVESFEKVLQSKGRARIDLTSEIISQGSGKVLARLNGRFVALKRKNGESSESV